MSNNILATWLKVSLLSKFNLTSPGLFRVHVSLLILYKNKIFQFCFQVLAVEREGFHMVNFHFSWGGAIAQQMYRSKIFDFGAWFWITTSSIKMLTSLVSSCNDKWLVLIPFLYQKLRVFELYQVLYGNYWEFETSDWEIVNISRMINGRNVDKRCKVWYS